MWISSFRLRDLPGLSRLCQFRTCNLVRVWISKEGALLHFSHACFHPSYLFNVSFGSNHTAAIEEFFHFAGGSPSHLLKHKRRPSPAPPGHAYGGEEPR